MCGPNEVLQQTAAAILVPESSRALSAAAAAELVFSVDGRVAHAKASVRKPDIFADTESVGVEAEWNRADYERLSGGC